MEGLIFGILRYFTVFTLGKFQVQATQEAYIWWGNLTEGFLWYEFGGLIFRGVKYMGAYFRNFTVCPVWLDDTTIFTIGMTYIL